MRYAILLALAFATGCHGVLAEHPCDTTMDPTLCYVGQEPPGDAGLVLPDAPPGCILLDPLEAEVFYCPAPEPPAGLAI